MTGYSPEERAGELFDAVSGPLRAHRNFQELKSELRAGLARTEKAFQELHDWISVGNPLPDPRRVVRLTKPLSNGLPSEDPRQPSSSGYPLSE